MWIHLPSTLLVFVQDTQESNLDSEKLSQLEQSAMWKSKSLQQRSWQNVWKRDTSIKLLSGLTSKPSTLNRGVEKWISSLEDSHVNPFQTQEKKLGADDERNLWPDTARLIWRLRPPIVFLENVPGILEYYFSEVRPQLQEMGYQVTEGLFSAVETGAPH